MFAANDSLHERQSELQTGSCASSFGSSSSRCYFRRIQLLDSHQSRLQRKQLKRIKSDTRILQFLLMTLVDMRLELKFAISVLVLSALLELVTACGGRGMMQPPPMQQPMQQPMAMRARRARVARQPVRQVKSVRGSPAAPAQPAVSVNSPQVQAPVFNNHITIDSSKTKTMLEQLDDDLIEEMIRRRQAKKSGEVSANLNGDHELQHQVAASSQPAPSYARPVQDFGVSASAAAAASVARRPRPQYVDEGYEQQVMQPPQRNPYASQAQSVVDEQFDDYDEQLDEYLAPVEPSGAQGSFAAASASAAASAGNSRASRAVNRLANGYADNLRVPANAVQQTIGMAAQLGSQLVRAAQQPRAMRRRNYY